MRSIEVMNDGTLPLEYALYGFGKREGVEAFCAMLG